MLVPTVYTDPETGEPLYVEYIHRSKAVRIYQQLRLFASIVWRTWEPGYRIGVRTAWDVAKGIWK
jgi:hypothetical protein